MTLEIRALGDFQLELNGEDITAQCDPTRIYLLIYLLDSARAQTRAHLAELLWPDRPAGRARTNLRTLLTRLRPLFADFLQIDQNWLTLQATSGTLYDVHAFGAAIKSAEQLSSHDPARLDALTKAVSFFQGDFLANVASPQSENLESWLMTRRLQLHGQAVQAIRELLENAHGAPETRIALARQLLQLEPLNEPACRTLMQLLAEQGQRDEALWHFQRYQRELSEIWSAATPSEDLVMLAAKIRLGMDLGTTTHALTGKSGTVRPAVPEPDAPPVHHQSASAAGEGATVASTNVTLPDAAADQVRTATASVPFQPFPVPVKPLIGRQEERERFIQWLDLGYRLISITGLGGVGKSHFTQTMLAAETNRWPAGGVYVAITEGASRTEARQMDSMEDAQRNAVLVLCRALAAALEVPLQSGQDYTTQLIQALVPHACCIVLDNFELLLAAAPFLQTMLAKAGKLTIVAISRRRLQLAAEANIVLDGLPSRPPDASQSGTATAPMVGTAEELLYRNFARHRPHFQLSAEDRVLLHGICQAVRGLPLALEMIPALTRQMPLPAVAALLHTDPLLLSTDFADTVEQQRSLYMLMDSMFMATAPLIQRALVRLTVFSTPFTAETARCVVNSKEWVELTEQRWLETVDGVYFSLHPLVAAFVRSLGAEQQWAAIQTAARRAHATYYADLVADQPFFQNPHYTETIAWLHQNFAEVTNACQALLAENPLDAVALLHVLTMYGQHFGDLPAVQLWLERGLAALPPTEPARFRLLLDYITCTTDQRDLTAAEAALAEARSQMDTQDDQAALLALYTRLAWAAHLDYAATTPQRRQEGIHYFSQALELAEAMGDQQKIATILIERAFLSSWVPANHEEARGDLRRALMIGHQLGQASLLASAYKFSAYVEFAAGHFPLAQRFNERALQLLEAEHGSALIRGWLCTERSQIALAQQDLDVAKAYLAQAEKIFGPAGYEAGLTQCNMLQGIVALFNADLPLAEHYWLRAYRAVYEMNQQDKLVVSLMLGVGVTQLIHGDPLLGAQLVAVARAQFEEKAFHWVPPEQQLMTYLLKRATTEIELLALPLMPVDEQMAIQALHLLAEV